MEKVYICCPYVAKTQKEIQKNINLAKQYALIYAEKGYNIICPHLNYSFLTENEREQILEMCCDIISVCDEIIVLRVNNKLSAGQELEIYKALALNKKITFIDIRRNK